MSDNDKIFNAILDIKQDIGTIKGHVESVRKSIPELFDRTGALQTQSDLTNVEVKSQDKRIKICESTIAKASAGALLLVGGVVGVEKLISWWAK